MAYWGVALASGPNINAAMDKVGERRAWDAVQKARSHRAHASPAEQAYIDAIGKRYNVNAHSRPALDKAYADAMRVVWRRFPNDPDAGVLFAEALMEFDCLSVSVEDAQAGTAEEKPLFGEPGADPGLWELCEVVAHFALESDPAETLAACAAAPNETAAISVSDIDATRKAPLRRAHALPDRRHLWDSMALIEDYRSVAEREPTPARLVRQRGDGPARGIGRRRCQTATRDRRRSPLWAPLVGAQS